ncbi:helix-turn-helix transcriptional regulator [Nocardioides sp. Bht2]|uniref:helix-turn-helix transcriptional regulator n=1 Tax=Nocardioides sp. Bht2 TaxID=3392297 RepID=UPI0039B55AAE
MSRVTQAAREKQKGSAEPTRSRVVLLSDQLLTREAMKAAISSRGVSVLDLGIPRGRQELRDLAHDVDQFGAQMGVLVQEQFDPFVVRDAERLIKRGPALHWMVLTSCVPGPFWAALLEAGADGVLPLDIGVDALIAALPALAEGEPVMDPADRALLSRHDVEDQLVLERLAQLSPREVQVLKQLSRGRTVAQLAVLEEVSEDTVRSHVRAILRKLKVSSQLAAVAEWNRALKGWPSSRSW